MKLVRAKQFLLTVTAVFSLFVSAVSACTCSHHESVRLETESCHSSMHEATAAEQPNGSDQVDAGCNCFIRTPVPAIVAKKDDKRTAIEQPIEDVLELPIQITIEFEIATAADVPFEPPHSNYQHALLSSLPSRAPPRP